MYSLISEVWKFKEPVPQEISGGVLLAVDMVAQQRDGPRRLRDNNDEDDGQTNHKNNASGAIYWMNGDIKTNLIHKVMALKFLFQAFRKTESFTNCIFFTTRNIYENPHHILAKRLYINTPTISTITLVDFHLHKNAWPR